MEQRTASWYALRKKMIGGSDVSSILGINPWKTSFDLWQEKMSDKLDVFPKTPAMQRGIDMEDEALQAFINETGYLMSPKVMISTRNAFMLASLDGYDTIDNSAAVEIKCGGHKSHELALEGVIPDYYISQVQHQIEVTGLDKIYYYSYRPEHEIKSKIIEVYRDDAYIAAMIEKESHFYHEHMLKRIAPDCAKIAPKLIETHQWITLTNAYKKLDYEIKESEKKREEIKDMLIQLSDAEPAIGNGLSLSKVERKGVIPYTSIPEVRSLDLEKHRKPGSTYWQLKEIER